MIDTLTIKGFKSIEEERIELAQVNVFIGANGSGKSNILEAMGVLGAAAEGRVADQSVLARGVRPGLPQLYKSAFRNPKGGRARPNIFLGASAGNCSYQVSLENPLADPSPAWSFGTENWQGGGANLSYGPRSGRQGTREQGLAALRAADLDEDSPALVFLRQLQQFVIYTPSTAVLRGTALESQPREPLGLSGGRLPRAMREVLRHYWDSPHVRLTRQESLGLIDWASNYGSALAASLPLSPAAASAAEVTRFVDRYMRPGRNVLSGYDASEGALFVLFLSVLACHPGTPPIYAVDNADHGLNPRLARGLFQKYCAWLLDAPEQRQSLLTTHNPLVLDGLPLQDDRVRLFTVSRTEGGRTTVQRVRLDSKLAEMANRGWTLSRLWVMGSLGGVPNV